MTVSSTHVPQDAGVTVLITGMPEYKYASVLIIFITCNKLTEFLSVIQLHEQVYNLTGVHEYSNNSNPGNKHEYSNNSNPGNRSNEPCNKDTWTFRVWI